MCGIVGLCLGDYDEQASSELLDAALVLQHRGQDACGIATADCRNVSCHRGPGLLMDVFGPANHPLARSLPGHIGLAHGLFTSNSSASIQVLMRAVRYSTTHSYHPLEAQPLYNPAGNGVYLAHVSNQFTGNGGGLADPSI